MVYLICVGVFWVEVDEVIEDYWNSGVCYIVVLCGDLLDGIGECYVLYLDGYVNVVELVVGI